jgi:integrase
MNGSMRQRSTGSWELRVFTGSDPATGRRCYRSKTVRGNRAEAERELAAMVDIAGRGPTIGAQTTVGELLERWYAVASSGWAPTTVRQTRSVLNRQLLPHLGAVMVGDLTTADIDTLYMSLRANGSVAGQPLAAGTIKRIHVVLRSALAQAVRWGWIWDNPAERAHRIPSVSREPDPPTPAELDTLLGHLRTTNTALYTFVVLAATSGARRAQLLGLRWRNVNLADGQVAFTNGWVEGPTGPVLTDTKTKRRHTVELDAATTEVLADHARRITAIVGGLDRDGFVFTNDNRGVQAWKPNWVTKAFQRAVRGAGLRRFRLHDLRHFMATEMLHAGVPIPIVSRRLDHRRISTTLDFYTHVTPSGDRFAAETLRHRLNR